MSITKLDQVVELVKSQPKKRLVAANANDAHTIEAVNAAVEMGVIDATLVGDTAAIEKVCTDLNIDIKKFKIVHETVDVKAAATACDLINNGDIEIEYGKWIYVFCAGPTEDVLHFGWMADFA